METKAKLIYTAEKHYFPTIFPANFYGLPDHKVYMINSRPYETLGGKSGLEFVIEVLEEFSYDYQKEKLLIHRNNKKIPVFFNMIVDKHGQKMKIIKVSRSTKTYFEAEALLNKLFEECLQRKLERHKFIRTKPPKPKQQ